jgi:hypothetical protein
LLLPGASKVPGVGLEDAPPRRRRSVDTLAALALEDGIEFEADTHPAVCARFETDIRVTVSGIA